MTRFKNAFTITKNQMQLTPNTYFSLKFLEKKLGDIDIELGLPIGYYDRFKRAVINETLKLWHDFAKTDEVIGFNVIDSIDGIIHSSIDNGIISEDDLVSLAGCSPINEVIFEAKNRLNQAFMEEEDDDKKENNGCNFIEEALKLEGFELPQDEKEIAELQDDNWFDRKTDLEEGIYITVPELPEIIASWGDYEPKETETKMEVDNEDIVKNNVENKLSILEKSEYGKNYLLLKICRQN